MYHTGLPLTLTAPCPNLYCTKTKRAECADLWDALCCCLSAGLWLSVISQNNKQKREWCIVGEWRTSNSDSVQDSNKSISVQRDKLNNAHQVDHPFLRHHRAYLQHFGFPWLPNLQPFYIQNEWTIFHPEKIKE